MVWQGGAEDELLGKMKHLSWLDNKDNTEGDKSIVGALTGICETFN